MASTIECPFCGDLLGMNDFLPVVGAVCPRCHNRVTPADLKRAAPASAKPAADDGDSPSPKAEKPKEAIACKERGIQEKPVPKELLPEPADEADEPEDEELARLPAVSVGRLLKRLDPRTAGALCAISLALLVGSIPSLEVLSKPLSALGLVLALVGGMLPALWKETSVAVPLGVAGLCLVVLLFVGRWPRFGDPPTRPVTIPLGKGGMVPNQPYKEGDWVDASKSALRLNDLRVEILSVQLGGVPIQDSKRKDAKPTYSKDKHLVIALRVTEDGGVHRQLTYQPWSDRAELPSKHQPTLTDNTRQSYTQEIFEPAPPLKIVGRGEWFFITPGHQAKDVLIYPPPADKIEYLRLELPASAFGMKGTYRFQIPHDMIQVTPQGEPTPKETP